MNHGRTFLPNQQDIEAHEISLECYILCIYKIISSCLATPLSAKSAQCNNVSEVVKMMITRHLLLLAESNLQSSLIAKQLQQLPNIDVGLCTPQDAIFRSHQMRVDLVFVDYDCLNEPELQSKLPDFDLFGWPLMVHNVPNGAVKQDLLRWKLLKGVLLKNASVSHMAEGVKYIFSGGLWLPRSYLEALLHHYRHSDAALECRHEDLTSRERQILELLSCGISNQQIATQLYLSESTIKSHIYKLYKKLDVHSRHDAIKVARINGTLVTS